MTIYGASPGQHDDLITALALCVQADPPRTASIMPYQGVHVGEQPVGCTRVDTRSTQPQHPFAPPEVHRHEVVYALAGLRW